MPQEVDLEMVPEVGAGGTRVGWKAGSAAGTTGLGRWVGLPRCSWMKYTGAGLTVHRPCEHSK